LYASITLDTQHRSIWALILNLTNTETVCSPSAVSLGPSLGKDNDTEKMHSSSPYVIAGELEEFHSKELEQLRLFVTLLKTSHKSHFWLFEYDAPFERGRHRLSNDTEIIILSQS